MRQTLMGILGILGVSLFCGVVIISIGLGSLITQLNLVAKPIVCGSDDMQVMQHVYSYRPGETSWTITAYCVDRTTRAKRDVTNLTQFVAGVIYSVIPFVVLLAWGLSLRVEDAKAPEKNASRPWATAASASENKGSEGVAERLEAIEKLRESNTITEEDYQKIKNKILENS